MTIDPLTDSQLEVAKIIEQSLLDSGPGVQVAAAAGAVELIVAYSLTAILAVLHGISSSSFRRDLGLILSPWFT